MKREKKNIEVSSQLVFSFYPSKPHPPLRYLPILLKVNELIRWSGRATVQRPMDDEWDRMETWPS